jgi:hypothetical protein
MKPCPEYRESIALLAARALDPAAKEKTEHHLESCHACRDHFENLRRVCGQLERVPPDAAAASPELPANFHRRLVERVRADAAAPSSSPPTAESFLAWFREWFSWPRVACAGAVAIMFLAAVLWMDHQRAPRDLRVVSPGTSPVMRESTPAPTLMAFSRALQESDVALDTLLARQERLLAANDPPSVALAAER